MTTTKQHHTAFTVGDRVEVSNGKPRPPKHHNRKVSAWECANYSGEVLESRDTSKDEYFKDYSPNGELVIRDDSCVGGWIELQHHLSLGMGGFTVEKIAA